MGGSRQHIAASIYCATKWSLVFLVSMWPYWGLIFMLASKMTLKILSFPLVQGYDCWVKNNSLYPVKSFVVNRFWGLGCLYNHIEVYFYAKIKNHITSLVISMGREIIKEGQQCSFISCGIYPSR